MLNFTCRRWSSRMPGTLIVPPSVACTIETFASLWISSLSRRNLSLDFTRKVTNTSEEPRFTRMVCPSSTPKSQPNAFVSVLSRSTTNADLLGSGWWSISSARSFLCLNIRSTAWRWSHVGHGTFDNWHAWRTVLFRWFPCQYRCMFYISVVDGQLHIGCLYTSDTCQRYERSHLCYSREQLLERLNPVITKEASLMSSRSRCGVLLVWCLVYRIDSRSSHSPIRDCRNRLD